LPPPASANTVARIVSELSLDIDGVAAPRELLSLLKKKLGASNDDLAACSGRAFVPYAISPYLHGRQPVPTDVLEGAANALKARRAANLPDCVDTASTVARIVSELSLDIDGAATPHELLALLKKKLGARSVDLAVCSGRACGLSSIAHYLNGRRQVPTDVLEGAANALKARRAANVADHASVSTFWCSSGKLVLEAGGTIEEMDRVVSIGRHTLVLRNAAACALLTINSLTVASAPVDCADRLWNRSEGEA
jgi:hypothetical protein